MIAKELIKELQKLEDDTEIYTVDGLGCKYQNFGLYYDEHTNTAGIL